MGRAGVCRHDLQTLDTLTGGAFTAPTSGERAQRVRDWLAGQPSLDQMQEVFKELSGRDKGAARLLREKLDELKRAKGQQAIASEWAQKAEALLAQPKLNIADALAWQRDAAKAGAPLSREPLAAFKGQLAERVKGIEDLQHRTQVHREAAVLLAQRFEVLSTKGWPDAQAAQAPLRADVAHWLQQAADMAADANWSSLDAKFAPQLEASRAQLLGVSEAFHAALVQALAAAADAAAPLPPVPVWADELRVARGEVVTPQALAAKPARPPVDPTVRNAAQSAVEAALAKLEQETVGGHGKASAGAAAALRAQLKEHGKLVEPPLEARVHAALVAAGELEGWQRWSADKVREELVAKAEGLFVRAAKKGPRQTPAAPGTATAQASTSTPVGVETAPVADIAATAEAAAHEKVAPATEATSVVVAAAGIEPVASAGAVPETPASAAPAVTPADGMASVATPEPEREPALVPRFGGRKMQETLRSLREQWKQADQGGVPNHALWKRFDAACNEAHKVVEAWLDKVRADAAQFRAQRVALIEEVAAWAVQHASGDDLKAHNRALHHFADRWRDAGHIGEKMFSELQPLWNEAFGAARAPLENAQKASLERRHAMIAEATELGAHPMLRIDAVKALQQRWQAEAQSVPLDRRHEQKLWDAFRAPIDEAFNRKTADREKTSSAMSEHDRYVLDASKALDAANAAGDVQKIRTAVARLEAALRGEAPPPVPASAVPTAAPDLKPNQAATPDGPAQGATELVAPGQAGNEFAESAQPATTPAEDDANGPAAALGAPHDLVAPADGADASARADGASSESSEAGQAAASAPAAAPKPAAKPVVAMRGDDRPSSRRGDAAPTGRAGGKFGDRRDSRSGPGGPGRLGDRGGSRSDARGGDRFGDRPPRFDDRGPRLGDAAFRAQREALERADVALRKLAAQAHGEALMQVMSAWEKRDAAQLPSAHELGRAVSPAVRTGWSQAVDASPTVPAAAAAAEALLRLEMAAEVPTPADQLDARRALQLKLLTRRNDPPPAHTWGEDAGKVLAAPHEPVAARRLQNALKALLRK